MRPRALAPIVALVALSVSSHAAAQQPPVPPQEQPAGSEVLTRGPVHEAFAEPVAVQAEAGLVAPAQPPRNIDEVPPAERPQGANYVWVPGYWSWDADRNGYIWVSACWRVAPPDMSWVPGYWNRVAGGWEWVPGFWTRTGSREIDYLPAPPAPVDIAPSGPPPGPDIVWVPGCWYWQNGVYVVRRGYWLHQQPGWIWEPSHTRWTPRGYVFVEGHWDYALADRGILFAPVYFPQAVYARAGFYYSPSIALDVAVLIGDLFTYPRYGHYYFGDWYDDAYVRVGIYPRFDCERVHTWYDPIYYYDRWQYGRTNPHWGDEQRQDYDHRRSDRNLRPPRTYSEQVSRMGRTPVPPQRGGYVAGPLASVVGRRASEMKLERIDPEARRRIVRDGTGVRSFGNERVKWEAPASPPAASRPGGGYEARVGRPVEGGQPPASPAHGPKGTGVAPQPPAPSGIPREVRVTQPERVRIPAPPAASRGSQEPGYVRRPSPPQPADERRQPAGQGKAKGKAKQD